MSKRISHGARNRPDARPTDYRDNYIIEYDLDYDPVVETPPSVKNRRELDRVLSILDDIKQGGTGR